MKVSHNTIGKWPGDICKGSTEASSRRVEEEMRIPVAEAMQSSRNTAKRARKLDQAAKAAKTEASKPKPAISKPAPPKETSPAAPAPARKTEFDKRALTRLNDIVQAPPNLTKLPRGVAAKRKAQGGHVPSQREGVISMAQKQRMEEERENAIKRYRELKELRAAAEWTNCSMIVYRAVHPASVPRCFVLVSLKRVDARASRRQICSTRELRQVNGHHHLVFSRRAAPCVGFIFRIILGGMYFRNKLKAREAGD